MIFPFGITAQWIADLISAEVVGDGNAIVAGINEIHKVTTGDIVFVDHPKYYDKCINSAATFIIINTKDIQVPAKKTLLITDDPFEAYLKIVAYFRPFTACSQMIHSSAIIGNGTTIMPNVFIGPQVVIGKNCIIHTNVTIYDHCIIGDNVVIHSGTVIGADAFYYNSKKNRSVWYKKMASCGRVVIEDDVEIGANCCIDKGVTNDTIIGQGTKMDNLIQIGHDVVIGKNCIIASQVGIAGATIIGDGVTLWGQVGVSKTLSIGDNATVLAQSGVPYSLEGNKSYFGSPAIEAREKQKEIVWIKRIPELWQKIMGN